jgi:hypothetical protein
MSEKIYACLLRLYPAKFRQAYGEDALQLFRDRLRDETGVVGRTRLWLDLFLDLAISLPRQYTDAHSGLGAPSVARFAGTPLFFVLEEKSLRPAALLSGYTLNLAALGLASVLLSHSGRQHGPVFRSTGSEFLSVDRQISAAGKADADSAARQVLIDVTFDESATFEHLFPSQTDFSVRFPTTTDARANSAAQQDFVEATPSDSVADGAVPVRAAGSFIALPVTSVGGAALDPDRQRVFDAVIANVRQHYFDPAVAQQIVDALITRQRRGDDAAATNGKDFAALLTTQMRDVSQDMHLELVYIAKPAQSSPQEFARMLTTLQKDNCSFKKVQILPHNIGYLKLDAFLDPSVCSSTATAAMASLNHSDALIFDLRDNRGGTAEMVSLISSYLFDHPEYMFDPRRVPTPQSWTSSPVPDSKLANKLVFILTSSTTISAAEQFTYDLKMLKRATIVGETTAGGAHAGVFHRIDDHYGIAIPENRAVNPYSKSDWEATGIRPDIEVAAAAALETAVRQAQSQLQKK